MSHNLASFPTPPEAAHTERMSPGFLKLHLPGGPLHIFTWPDSGPAHDHPWGFTTHIIEGGYIEEVFTVNPDGTHTKEVIERKPGTSHQVEAGTIHRIISLPAGFCVTRIEPGPPERVSGFYDFASKQVAHRFWNDPPGQWRVIAPASAAGQVFPAPDWRPLSV